MDLSVIIVSFNTKQLVDDCLSSVYQSLQTSKLTYEIIVVDNLSTDGTREMLGRKYRDVITILNSQNLGFGKGNNQGIRKAKGKYIMLLNSDTVILEDAIERLYAFALTRPNAFTGPALLNKDKTPQTSCGPFFTLPVVFAALFLKGDVIGLTRWSPNKTRIVDWVSGACIIASKKLFSDDLLFDEGIFMYMEEIDLFMRAKKKGYKTYFYKEPRIVHLGAASSTNKRTGPVLNIYRGFLYLYKKHYSPRSVAVLRLLLRLKAILSIGVGYLTGSQYLKTTYAQALQLV